VLRKVSEVEAAREEAVVVSEVVAEVQEAAAVREEKVAREEKVVKEEKAVREEATAVVTEAVAREEKVKRVVSPDQKVTDQDTVEEVEQPRKVVSQDQRAIDQEVAAEEEVLDLLERIPRKVVMKASYTKLERRELTSLARTSTLKARDPRNGIHTTESQAPVEAEKSLRVAMAEATGVDLKMKLRPLSLVRRSLVRKKPRIKPPLLKWELRSNPRNKKRKKRQPFKKEKKLLIRKRRRTRTSSPFRNISLRRRLSVSARKPESPRR
jgi:hypothetical protein